MRIRSRTLIILFSESGRQAVTLALQFVLVWLMTKTDYGTYRQVELYFGLVTGLLLLNLPASLYYYVPKRGRNDSRGILAQTLLLSLAAGALGALVLSLGADRIAGLCENPALAAPLRVYSLQAFGFLVSALIPAFFISTDQPVRSAVYTLALSLLRAAPVILLAALGYPLWIIFLVLAICLTSGAALGMVDAWRCCGGRVEITRASLAEQFAYVLPLQAAAVVGILNRRLDQMLVTGAFDAEQYGVYAAGAFELPLVGMITMSVANAVMPNLVVLVSEGKGAEALTLWKHAVRQCSLVIYPCFALALLCGDDLIRLLLKPGYERATWPFIVFLFALPIRVANYGAILRAFANTRPVIGGAALGLTVNVALGLLLLWLGRGTMLAFVGPAIAVVVAEWCNAAYLLRHIRQTTGVAWAAVLRWRELATTLALCMLAAGATWCLPLGGLSPVVRLPIVAVAYGGVLAGLFLLTGHLRADERDLVAWFFRKLGLLRPRTTT